MHCPLDGGDAKLARAYENIRNLEREIGAFLRDGQYPVVSDEDPTSTQEAAKLHTSRPVPIRFSILAAEIIHHLRS
jgi:hypothetical protein